jgi:hypothetical protein
MDLPTGSRILYLLGHRLDLFDSLLAPNALRTPLGALPVLVSSTVVDLLPFVLEYSQAGLGFGLDRHVSAQVMTDWPVYWGGRRWIGTMS